MGMLIGMPVLLLVVFGYAANFTVDNVPLAAVGPKAQQVAQQVEVIAQAPFDVVEVDPGGDAATAEDLLQRDSVDVAIDTGQQPPVAYIDGSSLFTAQTSIAAFNRLGDQVTVEILFNPELKTSWVMVPAIIGLILTFIGTIITSIGMVKEKQTGTIEQLAVMPIKPSTVILGKILPYFLLATLDMVLVTVLAWFCSTFRSTAVSVSSPSGPPVPLRGSGPRRIRLDHFAERRSGDSDRLLLPAPDPAVRFHLPAGGDPGGPLDQLLPAADLFHDGVAGRHAARAPLDALWFPLIMLAIMAVVIFTGRSCGSGGTLATSATAVGRSRRCPRECPRVDRAVRARPGPRRCQSADTARTDHRGGRRGQGWQNHPARGSGGSGPDRGRNRGFTGAVHHRIHARRAGS